MSMKYLLVIAIITLNVLKLVPMHKMTDFSTGFVGQYWVSNLSNLACLEVTPKVVLLLLPYTVYCMLGINTLKYGMCIERIALKQ